MEVLSEETKKQIEELELLMTLPKSQTLDILINNINSKINTK